LDLRKEFAFKHVVQCIPITGIRTFGYVGQDRESVSEKANVIRLEWPEPPVDATTLLVANSSRR